MVHERRALLHQPFVCRQPVAGRKLSRAEETLLIGENKQEIVGFACCPSIGRTRRSAIGGSRIRRHGACSEQRGRRNTRGYLRQKLATRKPVAAIVDCIHWNLLGAVRSACRRRRS